MEFADRSWAEQFVTVHRLSMKQQYGAIIEYVDHSYVERHRRPRLADRSGEKSSSRQQKRRLSESEERESGVEEGEVDSDEDDDTEMGDSARRSRRSAVRLVVVECALWLSSQPCAGRFLFA